MSVRGLWRGTPCTDWWTEYRRLSLAKGYSVRYTPLTAEEYNHGKETEGEKGGGEKAPSHHFAQAAPKGNYPAAASETLEEEEYFSPCSPHTVSLLGGCGQPSP